MEKPDCMTPQRKRKLAFVAPGAPDDEDFAPIQDHKDEGEKPPEAVEGEANNLAVVPAEDPDAAAAAFAKTTSSTVPKLPPPPPPAA